MTLSRIGPSAASAKPKNMNSTPMIIGIMAHAAVFWIRLANAVCAASATPASLTRPECCR